TPRGTRARSSGALTRFGVGIRGKASAERVERPGWFYLLQFRERVCGKRRKRRPRRQKRRQRKRPVRFPCGRRVYQGGSVVRSFNGAKARVRRAIRIMDAIELEP